MNSHRQQCMGIACPMTVYALDDAQTYTNARNVYKTLVRELMCNTGSLSIQKTSKKLAALLTSSSLIPGSV